MSIRHSLLALLQDRPRYGYQLRVEFEASTGATWPLNIGQVYTTLSRLDRDGLVTPGGDDEQGRTLYEITEKVSWLRVVALLLNVFAVVYILWTKRLFGIRGGREAFERERASVSLLEVERAAVGQGRERRRRAQSGRRRGHPG